MTKRHYLVLTLDKRWLALLQVQFLTMPNLMLVPVLGFVISHVDDDSLVSEM
jgi:hypothetical protein